LEDLTVTYPGLSHPALNRLHFKVPRGDYFGLLGPNGAGKTSLISFLCGQVEGIYRKATVLGHPRREIHKYKRRLGYAPQEIALYPTLSALENLRFFARLMGAPQGQAERVLEWVGMQARARTQVGELSGGMKRRLNLGVALLNDPDLLILDEPTVGIDPETRNFIFERILELKSRGTTLIYSTHYLEEVRKLCDQVAILRDGEQVVCGTVNSVLGEGDLEQSYLEFAGARKDPGASE
jgi:ABC-2 type transport system ATP-binding protein